MFSCLQVQYRFLYVRFTVLSANFRKPSQNPIEYASLKDAKVHESIRTLGCNAQVGNYSAAASNGTKGGTVSAESAGAKHSIREEFVNEIELWRREGRSDEESFILGSTGDVLQGLGAIESDIYMMGGKINKILKDHPEMTLDEVKRIPQILEDPILVLESNNSGRRGKDNTRLVLFGSVKAKDGLPVLVALDIKPIERNLVIDGMQKVTSAYTKDVNPVEFLRGSRVLYVDNKKTTSLLRTMGFKAPIELNDSGFIGSISYNKQNVKFHGKPFADVVMESAGPTSDSDIRYSDRKPLSEMTSSEKAIRFSYDELIKRPDIVIANAANPSNIQVKSNIDLARESKKIAVQKGYAAVDSNGKTQVYVKDIGGNITLTTKGITHGFRRDFSGTIPVILNIGEVLSNSIAVNELNPKNSKADYGYVLFGAARTDDGKINIVRFIVNHITLELEEVDNLKAIDIKKETAVLNAPGVISSVTVSAISVSDILKYVNTLSPDTLSESVLRHFGRTERPNKNYQEPGNFALYSERDTSLDPRTLLSNALAETARNDIEKKYISEYQNNISRINAEQEKLANLKAEIRELSFARGPRDKVKLRSLQEEATKTGNRIDIYDKKLLRLESTKPLQMVIEREKAKARKKAPEEGRASLDRYRERAAAASGSKKKEYTISILYVTMPWENP